MVDAVLRKLGVADAAAMYELRLRGLLEDSAAFGSSYDYEVALPDEQILARATPGPDRFTCGAFLGKRLVGLVTIGRSAHRKVRHVAGITGMYVVPECRRGGLGRRLLDFAIQTADAEMDGLEQVTLDVIVGVGDAQGFYRNAGFVPFGHHHRAVRDGEEYRDIVLMCREIREP